MTYITGLRQRVFELVRGAGGKEIRAERIAEDLGVPVHIIAEELRRLVDDRLLEWGSPAVLSATSRPKVFVGHGRSRAWKDLRDFLVEKLELDWIEFEKAESAGLPIAQRLEQMLDEASFAFLVLTAEDEAIDGTVRARQNVIHEVGLFQGRIGFSRAIILLEEGCDEFSNIHGLVQIRFPRGNIQSVTERIRGVLKREGFIL